LVSKTNQLVVGYAIILIILTFFLYVPDLLGYPLITVVDKTNIILTATIAMFAIIQGIATFNQYELQNREILVENAKNELEKAFGPLYTILNCPISETETYIRMSRDTKIQLDSILSTYPFMFTDEIRGIWKEKVQRILPVQEIGLSVRFYQIPIEFRNSVNKEYEKRLQKYKQLLGEK
jgi:hypothetical protein